MSKLVGLVSVGVFILGMLTATGMAQSASDQVPEKVRSTTQMIIDDQFQAFRDRNHEQAFSYAAPTLQKIFGSTQRFIMMVKRGYGAIYDARSWSFGRSRLKEGTVYQEVLVNGPNGKEWVALYEVLKQPDGSWRIGGVKMVRANGTST